MQTVFADFELTVGGVSLTDLVLHVATTKIFVEAFVTNHVFASLSVMCSSS